MRVVYLEHVQYVRYVPMIPRYSAVAVRGRHLAKAERIGTGEYR